MGPLTVSMLLDLIFVLAGATNLELHRATCTPPTSWPLNSHHFPLLTRTSIHRPLARTRENGYNASKTSSPP